MKIKLFNKNDCRYNSAKPGKSKKAKRLANKQFRNKVGKIDD